MSKATFSVTALPLGPGEAPATQFRLSCEHGETLLSHLSGPAPDEKAVLALLATRHEAAEHCGCAATLTWEEARA